MPKTREEKKSVMERLLKVSKESVSIAFVNFHGLTVGNAMEVRRQLRSAGVGYFVAKKTLLRKALSESKIAGELPAMEGELGIAYGADPVAPAREIFSFEKKLEKKISLQGGVFEGRYINKEEITAIAAIPPLQTLRAQFVNLINSGIQGLVMALDGVAKKKV